MSLATNQPVEIPYPARYLAARLVLDELRRRAKPGCLSGGLPDCDCIKCLDADLYATWNDGQLPLLDTAVLNFTTRTR